MAKAKAHFITDFIGGKRLAAYHDGHYGDASIISPGTR